MEIAQANPSVRSPQTIRGSRRNSKRAKPKPVQKRYPSRQEHKLLCQGVDPNFDMRVTKLNRQQQKMLKEIKRRDNEAKRRRQVPVAV